MSKFALPKAMSGCELDLPQINKVATQAIEKFLRLRLSKKDRQRGKSEPAKDKVGDEEVAEVTSALAEVVQDSLQAGCPSLDGHKIVVVTFSTPEDGQGLRVDGNSLWNEQSDRCLSINRSIRNVVFVVNLYFVKHHRRSDWVVRFPPSRSDSPQTSPGSPTTPASGSPSSSSGDGPEQPQKRPRTASPSSE